MARIDTLANFLTDVATAIKTKTGKTDPITPADFDTEITNLPSGGSEPEKGIVIQEYDSVGWPVKVKIVGMTNDIPDGYLALYNKTATTGGFFFKYVTRIILPDVVTIIPNYFSAYQFNLENINLPDNITHIGNNAFNENNKLSLDSLPSSLTSIGDRAFYNNTNLTIEQLPDELKTIGEYAFYNSGIKIKTIPENVTSLDYSAMASCKNIIQLSTTKVNTFGGGGTSNGGLRDCTNLKALWIGTNNGAIKPTIYQYAFNNNTSLQKIYIDLPRATVETISGYQYAFMNDASKIGIIICNDDEDFMTKEEFDAIDWATYTETEEA